MSYIITIARLADGEDAERTLPIPPEEWDRLTSADPTLEPEPPLEASGQSVRLVTDPKRPRAVFCYQPEGVVHLYGTSEPAVRKAVELATALGARVFGEEREFLDEALDASPGGRGGCLLAVALAVLLALLFVHQLAAA